MATINDLRIGINNVLDKEFPNITIYNEKIEQDFEEPCFFVKILSSEQDKELNIRYKKNVFFDIHYFSDKEDINSDCLNMADKFYDLLEYVQVNDNLYRATNMTHEVIDGVLHFFLQFNYKVIKEIEKAPKMNKLKQEVYLNAR
ncbi:phage tail terminator family protein [Clostridium brassicae]|uniref:phage tail terminator family protein n=1 Tax=Clostridium brassicae TaxID=2999072 RepID=UPI003898DE9A